ncbi:MAG: ABC transporter permease [Mesorhizobium sp.]|nr:ABC transporter permease [bacterium M00.F.Ca.ET.205.01.1.1]TGU51006.1 ABC transporter permease [bacterium M00.F.Ca.ET.152.01.1.1]TGV34496.1 ABC transporter permease [Mesorhizobium sp. M00.F.Ca.ET.186.01.1.1]TGZ41836.1 ABC transporter permease [bacterium M00.F.Ca.ET.162.01.1.1]TIW62619.1 MAG: ABC transporter permease [Mesorhizobium sp.]
MLPSRTGFLPEAFADINAALQKHHLATTFSWQDVAQRYRRSRVGAFWLTINMGVMIGALGFVFGTLFRTPMQEYLPYICVSLIFWGFIASAISEGCTTFVGAEGIILQVRMPLFTHVLRTLYRNAIILGHNILIYPLVLLAVGRMPTWQVFLAVPGFLVLSLNLLWIMLILAVLCARYRDMTQVMQNLLQVMMYLTPIMWMPRTLPEGISQRLLDLNPFYHLISVVRDPLLGELPFATSWIACIVFAVAGWTVALLLFGRYRHRIPYWL